MASKARFALAVGLMLVAVLAACDDEDGTGPVVETDVTGIWEGTTNGRDTSAVFTIELFLIEKDREFKKDRDFKEDHLDLDDEREGDEIEGSGTIRGRTSAQAVVVEGQVIFPDISLTLISEEFLDGKQFINFRGRFLGRDLIVGTLNGGPFRDVSLRLRRVEEGFIDRSTGRAGV